MHVLCLTTHTADCEKIWLSLEAANHQVTRQIYDDREHSRHHEFVELAKGLEPRLKAIVYIGAIEQYHGRPCLRPETLKALREVAPTIHICSDGCERVWWDLLNRYEKEGCFDAQVSIDGVLETPISRFPRGTVLLTPTDPRVFETKPWAERSRIVGMTGTPGHGERRQIIMTLRHRLGMPWKEREGSYADMAKFLCDCKAIVNCPANGTGDRDHVKGRVLEAGWASACLLERQNKIIEQWFQPDEYLAYTDIEDCIQKITWMREHEDEAKLMGERLRSTVSGRHHPQRFWGRVFDLANTRDELERRIV